MTLKQELLFILKCISETDNSETINRAIEIVEKLKLKVKKLTWENWKSEKSEYSILRSECFIYLDIYFIIEKNSYNKKYNIYLHISDNDLHITLGCNFNNIDEAKEFCQNYYEEEILFQMEE